MIAPLEARAASLWSRMQSPDSLPGGVMVYGVDANGISAIEEIITDFLKHGATVILSDVRPNVLHKLERAGVIRQLGSDNTTATVALAIERIKAIETVKEPWIRIAKRCKSTAQ